MKIWKAFLLSTVTLLLWIPCASAQFVLTWEQPATDDEAAAELLYTSGIFEDVISDLNTLFDIPVPIEIRFSSNDSGYGPHYYQGVVLMSYPFVNYLDQSLIQAEYSETLEEHLDTLIDVTEFILYHEVGHALIDVLDLPVLGKEEDAVDGFAAVLASSMDLDEVALAGADTWGVFASQRDALSEEHFWDSHSLDEQRFYTIMCLIIGSDPVENADLVTYAGFSEDRAMSCPMDFEQTFRSWARVLGDYIRE